VLVMLSAASMVCDAAIHVAVASLPLVGHLKPMAAVSEELIRRKIGVSVFGFDTVLVGGKHVRVKELLPAGVIHISLGQLDPDFDAYAETEVVAKMHRAFYGRLSNMAANSDIDVWMLDGHALGAIAVAEDLKASMVIFSTTIPSEFMQAQRVFRMQETVNAWPVIMNTAYELDPPKGAVQAMHGDYPDTFRFVGSVYAQQKVKPADAEVQQWLDAAQGNKEPVLFISLGTVKKLDMRDVVALMEALRAHRVMWSLPKEHQDKLNITVPEKFFLRAWLPQQAILHHPATVTFISHCGMNSAQESLLAAVPLICIPQSGEQVAIALRMMNRGVADMLAPTHFNNTELAQQVMLALPLMRRGNSHVDAKVKQLSAALREPGGVATAADIIEEVVRNRTNVFGVPDLAPQSMPRTASL